jgi:capsular exopolysaccharide synthesis family protein
MSRLYEALRKSEMENREAGAPPTVAVQPAEVVAKITSEPSELENVPKVTVRVKPESHLVALTHPQSLGAEKFRVLVTRLANLRGQKELRSIQVTSGVGDEGKTLVAANLAFTLATTPNARVLLVEGDLHKPSQAQLLGLNGVKGIVDWWSKGEDSLAPYLSRLADRPLWILSAGGQVPQPAEILQSKRFTEALSQLVAWFDWVIIDSTPLLPMADANIWNRFVDGTLLVVREGATPIKALKQGLESLDNPKVIGVVLNDASEFDRVNYYERYYSQKKDGSKNGHEKKSKVEAGE